MPRTPLQKMDAQRRYAWAQYYDVVNSRHEQDHRHYQSINRVVIEDTIPEHIKNELKEMSVALKKTWECPICMDFIEVKNLEITPCGHYYCKGCLTTLKAQTDAKCALCRKKFRTTGNSDSD